MTSLQVLGVGVRLFAVWLALSTIPVLFSANGLRTDRIPLVYHLAGPVLLVASALLWAFPLSLARRLLPDGLAENARSGSGLSEHAVARVGCGLVGVWCLANAAPKSVLAAYKALLFSGTLSFMEGLNVTGREEVVTSVTLLFVALLLILRSGVFAALVTSGPLAQDTAVGEPGPRPPKWPEGPRPKERR